MLPEHCRLSRGPFHAGSKSGAKASVFLTRNGMTGGEYILSLQKFLIRERVCCDVADSFYLSWDADVHTLEGKVDTNRALSQRGEKTRGR